MKIIYFGSFIVQLRKDQDHQLNRFSATHEREGDNELLKAAFSKPIEWALSDKLLLLCVS